jgi:hypothetical protein
MKKLLILAACIALTACASITGPDATPKSAQASYVEACADYSAAFEGARQLRVAGKLNKAQIDQVTLIDSQITPMCLGPLPADPVAATQAITAAVTKLVIVEGVQQGSK